MSRLWLLGAALVGATGCQGSFLRPPVADALPRTCAPASPRAEGDGCETVVQAPRQKVVVETPPPAPACQPGQSCQPAAAPTGTAGFVGGQMMAPSGMAMTTAQVRERTGIGFALD